MTDLTIQQASRHAVYVQRFGGYLSNLFDPYLARLQRELKILMIDAPEDMRSIRKANRLIAEYRKASTIVYGEYNSEVLLKELLEFAGDESEWQVAALDKAIDSPSVILSTPAPAQVWAAVNSTPLIFPDSNGVKMLEPFIKGWEQGQIEKVSDIIRTGFVTGRTNAQITQDIAGKGGYLDNQNRASIKSMVRTATTHTSNLARQATFDDNDDVILGYEWVSTLDSRTSSVCKGLDGKVFKNKDKDKRYPPAHPNACLKGSLITTCNGQLPIEHVAVGDLVLTHTGEYKKVKTIMAREHDGLARDLKDNFGRSVSLTNEHPILTRSKGWCEVGDIQAGDELFYNTEKLKRPKYRGASKVTQRILIESHNIVTKIADELISYGIFSNTRGVTSTINLDNDNSADNKVCDITSNWNLKFISEAKTIEYINQKLFVPSRCLLENLRVGFSNFYKGFRVACRIAPSHSHAGRIAAFLMPLRILSRPVVFTRWLRNKLSVRSNRVASASGFNSEINTSLSDGVVREVVFSFNKAKAFALTPVITFNNAFNKFIGYFFHGKSASNKWLTLSCTSIVEYHYKGWVYNLSVEDDETYVANGILVHNCRSSTAPVLDERYRLDDSVNTRASRGVEGGQQVNADLTYYSWLKEQGAQGKNGRAFVLDTLGKERGKLFLDGGLTADKFKQLTLDDLFQPIPLNELRKKQSLQLAFDKIDG